MENPERITYFGETDARNKRVKFGIKAKDRDRHMYIIGKTGMGKSTLLENMAIQDIENGEGLAFIDPHGSTAEKLLDYIPQERKEDVLYFAPFDMEYPVAFNVMEDVGYDKRHLVVSGLMSVFKKIWVDAWSARMEYILSNTLLALLEYPDSTLLDVNRMYVDKTFRKKVVDHVKDPLVKAFWEGEYATYTDRYTQEATPAIQNKIGQFTSNPLIRNIVGQAKSTFDLREMMDTKKIFIANLSKGRVGETNATLLGSMLTTKIYLSAMSRADAPAATLARLPHFYFYVDEFQSIANESFANILSEARKYKLNLVIAHQYIAQMEEKDNSSVRDAVFGNVGTTIAFRVGPFDAEILETIFAPKFLALDIVNLAARQIYLTLMIDGLGSQPFSARTLPPIPQPHLSFKDQIIAFSRKRYARPREGVENTILEVAKSSLPAPKEERKLFSGNRMDDRDRPPRRMERDPRDQHGRESFGGSQRDNRDHREREMTPNRNPRPEFKETPAQVAEKLRQRLAKQTQKAEATKDPTPENKQDLRNALSDLLKKAPAQAPSSPQPRVQASSASQPHLSQEHHTPPPPSPPPPPPPITIKREESALPQKPSLEPRQEVPEDVLRKLLEVKDNP